MATIIDIVVPTKGTLEFNFNTSLITAEDTIDTLTAQELANAIRDAEDDLIAETFKGIASMDGKTDIGNSVYTGIVIELLNDWMIVSAKTSGAFTLVDWTVIKTGLAWQVFAANPAVTQINTMTQSGAIALVEVSSIAQEMVYNGQVHIDLNWWTSGTTYPKWTLADPVDNLTDAFTIADSYNISTFQLAWTLTLDRAVDGKEFISWKNGKIDLNWQSALATRFRSLKVYGNQLNIGLFYDCRIDWLQNMTGSFNNCSILDNTISIWADGAEFINCRTQSEWNQIDIDMSAWGALTTKAFYGKIRLINATTPWVINTIWCLWASVTIDNTCTQWIFVNTGITTTTDNSWPAAVVVRWWWALEATVEGNLKLDEFIALK